MFYFFRNLIYSFFPSKQREVRMRKREENRGDGFPDTDLDDSDIKEENDQEAMDTTESGAAPNAANATDSGVSAPKDEIKDEIKEEKPDTDELDKQDAGTPSQPNKVDLRIKYYIA